MIAALTSPVTLINIVGVAIIAKIRDDMVAVGGGAAAAEQARVSLLARASIILAVAFTLVEKELVVAGFDVATSSRVADSGGSQEGGGKQD